MKIQASYQYGFGKSQGSQEALCPVCLGTGWETYDVGLIENYGYAQLFAKPCGKCKVQRRVGSETNVPPQFSETDLYKFKFESYRADMKKIKTLMFNFLNRYPEWSASTKGLYLWSKTPGSGKTCLACSLLNSIRIKYDISARFISTVDYLMLIGDSYKRQPGVEDESRKFRECDLLVLDDVGAEKCGEWQQQELFRLINGRLNEKKITLFTSNVPPEDLKLDDRIINRILKISIVIQMPEESLRLKQAQKEQEEFLKKMLAD